MVVFSKNKRYTSKFDINFPFEFFDVVNVIEVTVSAVVVLSEVKAEAVVKVVEIVVGSAVEVICVVVAVGVVVCVVEVVIKADVEVELSIAVNFEKRNDDCRFLQKMR